MSKAKYMSQRVDSAMSVIVWMERLTAHVFAITSNEKQFPKSLRFTLSEEAMSPEEKEIYAKQKREQYLSWKARTMRHDEDGFVVLVPRKNNKETTEKTAA